jgi:hypothetical protein
MRNSEVGRMMTLFYGNKGTKRTKNTQTSDSTKRKKQLQGKV